MKEREIFWQAARQLNAIYRAKTDCFCKKGLKDYGAVVFYDDDITVVLKGIKIWNQLLKQYGSTNKKAIFLGGKGLMSSWLYKETEGQHLAQVADKMGIEAKYRIILDHGTNTSECLEELQAYLHLAKVKGRCLFIVTQRLSLILKQSVAKQAPGLAADYYVVNQGVEDTLQLYNGMGLADGRPLLHFWAHVVNRFDRYDGRFMIKPFEPDEDTRAAGDLLAKHFLIKQRCGGLKKYLQYIPILWDLLLKKKAIRRAEAKAIAEAKKKL